MDQNFNQPYDNNYNQQPMYNNQQPMYNNQQPVYNNQQPMYNNQQPVYNNQQPVYNNQQPMYVQPGYNQPMNNQNMGYQPQVMMNQGGFTNQNMMNQQNRVMSNCKYIIFMLLIKLVLQNANYTSDPINSLAVAKSVYIKQTIEWVEMVSGYETPNRYQVYFKNQGDSHYTMLFSCKEMSDYCSRQCCSGDARPFTMNMKHISNATIDSDFNKNNFAIINKPYACACFCLGRPEMSGTFNSIDGPIFGKIYQPYTCCDPVFQVFNSSGQVAYSITTDCCQCGFFCRGGCGMFEPITFHIFNGNTCDSKSTNLAVGRIVKHSMGIQSLVSDADNFEVFFPLDASPENKLSLIAAALMIDYQYFEENPNQR